MASNSTSFKAGSSGNPAGYSATRRGIRKQIEGVLQNALPEIENQMQTGTPEVRRQLFIGLAGVLLQSSPKGSSLETGIAKVICGSQIAGELNLNIPSDNLRAKNRRA